MPPLLLSPEFDVPWWSPSLPTAVAVSGSVDYADKAFAGQGVARNDAEARKWFLLAAQAGDSGGQASLGRMYANGEGGPKDPVKGYIWYSVAADGGDQRSAGARDSLEETMTADQVAAARDTAMRCSQSKGKECE